MSSQIISKEHYFIMGYDCAINGANDINCNYLLFDTTEHKDLWEQGKKKGELFKSLKEYLKDTGYELISFEKIETIKTDANSIFCFNVYFTGNKNETKF